ncbi:Os02g0681800 [Oryza sativa Japonica Group]|uniref:Os02g0681800 protein n=1 Tax=Oryza sativa subsp. japonica TaxID=39947 RepID=A0A0P0VN04_ORYSJ|nr:Os02g0681800 [Oryza sativa Japonica Group]
MYQVLIPSRYRVIPIRYQEPGTKASSPVVPPSTSHAGARCRRPHPPPSAPRRSSSPAAASSVIHAPRRSSSPTAASSTVDATELVTGGRVLRHPHPTTELVADGRVLRHPRPTPELVADSHIMHRPRHVGACRGRPLPPPPRRASQVRARRALRQRRGEGSTFALYFLICRCVRAGLLLPCAGARAAGKELAVARGVVRRRCGHGRRSTAAHVSHACMLERHHVLYRLLLLGTCMEVLSAKLQAKRELVHVLCRQHAAESKENASEPLAAGRASPSTLRT